MSQTKILVGLSGGVDSALSVKLLKTRGYEVIGLYLDMHTSNDDFPVSVNDASEENSDIKSAFQCAQSYGIPLYKFGCAKLFDNIVKENFALEYAAGRTPNPCVICNRLVKFACLEKCADLLGCEKIATGHYANVGFDENSGRYYIEKGKDNKKEQSYMLWNLTQKQLSRIIFPLGNTVKEDNVAVARTDSLIAAQKKESLDICFIGENDNYASFIERRLGKFPEGNFISPDGKACGRHKGIIHYTVGQRKGLGIALGEPVFVKKIEKTTGNIYLAKKGEEFTDTIVVKNINFVGMPETDDYSEYLQVKIRYAASSVEAEITIKGDTCYVKFPSPVRAATPGQSAVFYRDSRVMFGGFIE